VSLDTYISCIPLYALSPTDVANPVSLHRKTLGIPVSDVTVTLKNAISNVNKHSLLSRGSMRLLAGDSYEV